MNNIAWFDGSSWYNIGKGVQPLVSAIEVVGQQLYAAGTNVLLPGETIAAGIARFNIDDLQTSVLIPENKNENLNLCIYPNPLQSWVSLQFYIPKPGEVRIALFNSQGKLIKALAEDFKVTGKHIITFDTGNFPQGIYLVKIYNGTMTESRQVILMK